MAMHRWTAALLFCLPGLLCAQTDHKAAPPPMVQVFGSVTDSVSGKPVYDSLVEFYDAAEVRKAVSSVNADGRYALFIPAGKPFELRITKENGYHELRKPLPTIPPGTAQWRQDLVLQPK